MTPQMAKELKRRSAIEPVIGHMKTDGKLGRNSCWVSWVTKSTPCSVAQGTISASSSRSCERCCSFGACLPQPENGTAYAGTSLLQIDTDRKLKMAFFKGDYL
jgi:hypothetical protein